MLTVQRPTFIRTGKKTKIVRITGVTFAAALAVLTACAGGQSNTAPPTSATDTGPSKERVTPVPLTPTQAAQTLYVLNTGAGQSFSVTVYGDGGAKLVRSINLGKYGHGVAIAVDQRGHLYAANGMATLDIYENQGSKLIQTIQQRNAFGELTLDRDGNLFTLCAADRLCEYAAGGKGRLKHIIRKIPLRKLNANAYSLAVDGSGDLAVNSRTEVLVFAPGKTAPYWVVPNGGPIAFDSSNNLYVGQNDTVAVYAPRGTSPIRTITDGICDPFALTFGDTGNLYVLNYGAPSCTASVTVYAPGGSSPIRTLTQELVSEDVFGLAVDSPGNVYVSNAGGISSAGSVVVYQPRGTAPKRIVTQGIQNPFTLAIGP